jgi:hypothetical protein
VSAYLFEGLIKTIKKLGKQGARNKKKEGTKHKRTQNTIALFLHDLHLLQGFLNCNIPALLRLNHLSTESPFLSLVRLTIGLHLGPTEV